MPEHPLCAVTRSTRVIEHFADLGAETGQDRGLEESVKTGKDDTADDYADDDFHTGVDIALTCDGLYGCLDGCKCLAQLVLDGIEKLFHVLNYLILSFLIVENENGKRFCSPHGAVYICCMV